MTDNRNRRKIVVVDGPMQRRMVVTLAWPTTLSLALTALVLVILTIRVHAAAAEAGVLLENVGAGVAALLAFLIIAAAFGLVHALRLSHRVAGPAYRLRETLRAVQAGDLGARAQLRDGDYLTETAEALNDFLGWLERHPPQREPDASREEACAPQGAVEATAPPCLAAGARDD